MFTLLPILLPTSPPSPLLCPPSPLPLQISWVIGPNLPPQSVGWHSTTHCIVEKCPQSCPLTTSHSPPLHIKKYWKILTTNTYTDAKTYTNTKGALKHAHVPRRPCYQINFQRKLVKRQMGQFQNLCSDDFLQSSRMTIRTYTAPRSDSYRAGLKNRSSPWCNPGVLSAQTFVVSDKHSSIQKTICHVSCPVFHILCMYSAMIYRVWNCYFWRSCFW